MSSQTEAARLARAKRRLAHEGLYVQVRRGQRWARYGLLHAETNAIVAETNDLDTVEEWAREGWFDTEEEAVVRAEHVRLVSFPAICGHCGRTAHQGDDLDGWAVVEGEREEVNPVRCPDHAHES